MGVLDTHAPLRGNPRAQPCLSWLGVIQFEEEGRGRIPTGTKSGDLGSPGLCSREVGGSG
jgi:hypothetical protein